MKIMIGHFTIESNEHVDGLTELDTFNLKFDEDLVQAMHVGDIFRKNDIDIIPAIFANGHTASVLSKEGYEYIHSKFLRTVRSEEHTSELQSRFDLVCRLLLEKTKSLPN